MLLFVVLCSHGGTLPTAALEKSLVVTLPFPAVEEEDGGAAAASYGGAERLSAIVVLLVAFFFFSPDLPAVLVLVLVLL